MSLRCKTGCLRAVEREREREEGSEYGKKVEEVGLYGRLTRMRVAMEDV